MQKQKTQTMNVHAMQLKKGTSDMLKSLDGSQVHHVGWEKPAIKGYILLDSIYITFQNDKITVMEPEIRNFVCFDGLALCLILVVVIWLYTYEKTFNTLHAKKKTKNKNKCS